MWAFLVWLFVYVILPAALAYLGGVLLAPGEPEDTPSVEGMQSRGWNAHTTQREGLPRPRAYGKNMHHGNIVSKWTDVDGNAREILYVIVEHTDGPTKGIGSNIVYLNDQPSSNFGSVVIQERTGTMDQTVMEGFEKTKLEYSINSELKQNVEQTWTTPNDISDDIEFTLCFPSGCFKTRKDGDLKASGVSLLIRIREHGTEEWTNLYNDILTQYSIAPLFLKYSVTDDFSYTINPEKQYDLSITKLSEDSAERHTNNIYFRSVREVCDVPFTRPGKALVGIKAIATSQLSGSLDIKVVREDRIINTYNGEAWTLQYSRNRAWVIWDILTQPVITGNGDTIPYEIERYEGIDPAYLDLEFFHKFSLFTDTEILDGDGGTEPRCPCDTIIDAYTDAFTLSCQLAEAGRAHLYWRGDKLTGWIDTVVTTPIDLVTMDTIMEKSWKNAWVVKDELAGIVEIKYQDAKQGYETTTAEYALAEAGGYQNSVTLEGIGITSRGAAIHYAAFHLTRNHLIRNINKFKVYKEGFRYNLGDVIYLQSRPANWGSSFRVESATLNTITVDRDVSTEISPGDLLHIRTYDTLLKAVVVDTYTVDSIDNNVITVTENWEVTPIKGNICAVGPVGSIKYRRITEIEPTVDNYLNVTVETYDEKLFDSDEIDPDNPNINYIWPAPSGELNHPITRAEIDDLIIQRLPYQPDIDIPWTSNITWVGSLGTTVAWTQTDEDDDITFRYKGTSHIITPSSTTNKYIYWNSSNPTVFLSTNLLSTAIASGNWVMCINESGVAYSSTPHQVLHGGLIQAGTITASYGQIADAAITNAKIADLAVDGAKIANAAITNAKIGNLEVDSAKIANLTVGTQKIVDNATKHQEIAYQGASPILVNSKSLVLSISSVSVLGGVIIFEFSTNCDHGGTSDFIAYFYEGTDDSGTLMAEINMGTARSVTLKFAYTPSAGTTNFCVYVMEDGAFGNNYVEGSLFTMTEDFGK